MLSGLYAQTPLNIPLWQKKHIEGRLKFAKQYLVKPVKYWENIDPMDAILITRFGGQRLNE